MRCAPLIPSYRAGLHVSTITCPSGSDGVEYLAHLVQPVRVGEPQCIVDNHRDGVFLGDQGGAGQSRQDAELLLGPTRQ